MRRPLSISKQVAREVRMTYNEYLGSLMFLGEQWSRGQSEQMFDGPDHAWCRVAARSGRWETQGRSVQV